jgi:NADPH:quinone reductase-like Zn-dependent oxidoreductase
MRNGGWARYVAVPTARMAQMPPAVTMAQAATLPVAGLTALYALAKGGQLIERSVLITGATGGVGDYAIQLARLSGARVAAHVRRADQEAQVRDAGADFVAIGEDLEGARQYGPYDLVLDSVGGAILPAAMTMLTEGGTCVSFGTTGGNPVTVDASTFYAIGRASLYGFILFDELGIEPASLGLARLGRLVAAGRLRPRISLEASWTEIASMARKLTDRQYPGKAVLHVDDGV